MPAACGSRQHLAPAGQANNLDFQTGFLIDLAISAYNSADEHIRVEFDNITSAMTSILTAVGDAMREVKQDKTRATLAEQATGWVKPLVALAGGIINGGSEADVDYIMTH